MRLCFPVKIDEGIDSTVYNHFGSAPLFLVVDTRGDEVSAIDNGDLNHVHGACNPMKALDSRKVDAIIVGGIGAGALMRLNQMGIVVYRSRAATVRENLALHAEEALSVLTVQDCCGHGRDGDCAHQ